MNRKFHSIIIIILVLVSSIGLSQQTKPAKKTSTNNTNDLDKLVKKYKNGSKITLFTIEGDLIGEVTISYNADSIPEEITISGNSDNEAAVITFLTNTIDMKTKQGYKIEKPWPYPDINASLEYDCPDELNSYGSEGFHVVFIKGNMYFTADACRHHELRWNSTTNTFDDHFSNTSIPPSYSFSITTGDYKKKGGKKATKFEF